MKLYLRLDPSLIKTEFRTFGSEVNPNPTDFATRITIAVCTKVCLVKERSLELRFWSDILTYKRILGVSAEKPELDWIDIPAE
ncbi:hypothetical protein Avbf_16208 [Armadillidium vulgare]|nr:hypothetical protein Avbf_16208 [Armadillidium vulgare]